MTVRSIGRAMRLAPGAEVIPSASAWIVRANEATVTIPLGNWAVDGDRLLDLLDGSRDTEALAVEAGILPHAVEALVNELDRLGLMEDGAAAPPVAGDRHSFATGPDPPATQAPTLRVLLVGLGPLGLGVLTELLKCADTQVHVFDAGPVTWIDVGPFYGATEIGYPRAQIVSSALGDRTSDRVRRVEADVSTPAAARAALATTMHGLDVVLCCMDQPTAMASVLEGACREAAVPLVVAEVGRTTASVGPVSGITSLDLSAGCAVCAAGHRAARDAFLAALPGYLAARFPRPARWRHALDPHALAVVAQLTVLAAVKAIEIRDGRRRADSNLVSIDLRDRTAVVLPVAKHHACARCFPVADSSPSALRRETERRWTEQYRRSPVPPLELPELRRRLRPLTAEGLALFHPLRRLSSRERRAVRQFLSRRGVEPDAIAIERAHRVLCSRPATARTQATTVVTEGFDFQDLAAAEALALVEGLERLFALEFCQQDRVLHARYAAIAADALDPRTFPLHAPAQYREAGFGLRPFDAEETMPWLWGIRVADDRPLLVPADLVYGCSPGAIYRATSNGAACHTSLHHAILNAIHETIERDAFMVAWLARLSLPRIALGDADPDPFGVRRSYERLGFGLEHVNLTTDLGIPVVLGVLRDRLDPDFFLVDMVAAPTAERTLAKLYRELSQFTFPHLIDPMHYRNEVTAGVDVDRVVDFPDHLRFYQRRDKLGETVFLDGSPRTRSLSQLPWQADARPVERELDALVEHLASHGHDLIVVDCTTGFLAALGLHAVKVLVPGLLPLNAGHRYRVLGGRRPFTAPVRMAAADRELALDDLNPWPHPFW